MKINEKKLEELCEFVQHECIKCAKRLGMSVECRTKGKCNDNCPFKSTENVLKWLSNED